MYPMFFSSPSVHLLGVPWGMIKDGSRSCGDVLGRATDASDAVFIRIFAASRVPEPLPSSTT
jgi:hypothetical protein